MHLAEALNIGFSNFDAGGVLKGLLNRRGF
jgi:hypothetical protein